MKTTTKQGGLKMKTINTPTGYIEITEQNKKVIIRAYDNSDNRKINIVINTEELKVIEYTN